MLVKSLATVLVLIAGFWATFRPLHPVEEHVARLGKWPRFERVFILLATFGLLLVVWSF